jgi:cell division transport system permease protein
MRKSTPTKRKLGSYPILSVVFSITLSLVIMGLFGALAIVTNALTTTIKENVEVQVYLDKPIATTEITRIQKTIASKPYVLNRADLQSITYISKEEAAAQFIKDTGEDFTSFLGENPLRDLLIVKVDVNHQSVDSLNLIKKEIEQIKGVFEVTYIESLVQSINKNLAKIGGVLLSFSAVLLIVVVILINNTIKLALFSQRFLIRSMQLIGATSGFIQRPFLYRAFYLGIISGLLSSGIVYFCVELANRRVEDLKQFYNDDMLLILFGSLMLAGVLVAFISTYAAMRKYLKVSLDELY